MLDPQEIDNEISKWECLDSSYKNYQKLADLYIIRDHLMDTRHLSMESAEKWTDSMCNEDGSKGPHWTIDQAKQIMEQREIEADPIEWWASINMIYSDFYEVAKKHNVCGSVDFFADMANAFLKDKDVRPGKAARYYECVVK